MTYFSSSSPSSSSSSSSYCGSSAIANEHAPWFVANNLSFFAASAPLFAVRKVTYGFVEQFETGRGLQEEESAG
jgi:hypothetical protein